MLLSAKTRGKLQNTNYRAMFLAFNCRSNNHKMKGRLFLPLMEKIGIKVTTHLELNKIIFNTVSF
jgi:hypothetical protein